MNIPTLIFPFHGADDTDPLLSDDNSKDWMTVKEVKEITNHWAEQLYAPRTLVFHYITNTTEGVCQFLGALQAGHAVVLLDPNLPEESKVNLVRNYQPGIILSDSGVEQGEEKRRHELHGEVSVLLSTSGSTGSPKLVRLSADNLESNAHSIAAALDIVSPEVGCAHLALHYSYGLSVLTSHLIKNAPVHLTERNFLDKEFWIRIRRWNISHLPGVPFHYQMLRRFGFKNLDLPKLRVMTQAGGMLDVRTRKMAHDFMQSIGGRFHVMYGQTEAAPRITTLSHEAFADHADSVGPALSGGRLEIYDIDNNLLPAGEEGNVVYVGPNVMMGYAQSATDLSLGDVNQGRLETGDIGWLDAEGRLTITGRSKRVGKIAGLRVNLDEVERLLVAELGELAVTDAGETLIIHHLPVEDAYAMRQRALSILMARYTLPQVTYLFRAVDEIPKTSRGKIEYKSLI